MRSYSSRNIRAYCTGDCVHWRMKYNTWSFWKRLFVTRGGRDGSRTKRTKEKILLRHSAGFFVGSRSLHTPFYAPAVNLWYCRTLLNIIVHRGRSGCFLPGPLQAVFARRFRCFGPGRFAFIRTLQWCYIFIYYIRIYDIIRVPILCIVRRRAR